MEGAAQKKNELICARKQKQKDRIEYLTEGAGMDIDKWFKNCTERLTQLISSTSVSAEIFETTPKNRYRFKTKIN